MSAIYTIEDNGYPAELHTVITDDSYKLTVHRIPFSPKNNHTQKRIPVLMIHGFFESSDSYLTLGAGRALCFILADEGYDVWLANMRGNIHSRGHASLDPDKDEEFWNFSFEESGMYDLPSMIDYIRSNTGEQKLHLVAHSQGTTLTFAGLSEKLEYNDKVISFSAFAPATYLSHMRDPLRITAFYFHDVIHAFSTTFGIYEMLVPGKNHIVQKVVGNTCSFPVFRVICTILLTIDNSLDFKQLEFELVPDILVGLLGGGSYKQVFHWAHLIRAGKFIKYDYGEKNLEIYNQAEPPVFNLAKITAPVGIFYGKNDLQVVMQDVEKTASELKSVRLKYLVPYDMFSHHDFLIAKDAKTLLYDRTIQFMKDMENQL